MPPPDSSYLEKLTADKFAEIVAKKVIKSIHSNTAARNSQLEGTTAVLASGLTSKAKNFQEFCEEYPDFEIVGEDDLKILRCQTCYKFLTVSGSVMRSLKGHKTGTLSLGLQLEVQTYKLLMEGHCDKWYNQKAKLLDHVACETHTKATLSARSVDKRMKQETLVVKNLLRTSLGVVKTNSAAIQYESRVAELYAAGADVGDYGHSRKLFPDMISVACAYIDEKTSDYLSSPLPNTGLRPHFYVTADKSSNLRTNNQISLICIVDGKRQGIPTQCHQVYQTSDGFGDGNAILGEVILEQISNHFNIKNENIMQMQGKVVDGQYLNDKLISAMNNNI